MSPGRGKVIGLWTRLAAAPRDVSHLATDPSTADATLPRVAAAGVDLPTLTSELERAGVRSFCDSYHELLDCIERKVAAG